ncbi:pilus assembly protein TadG-related protein [Salipaludibacillus sp. CF4.18]|uniref:pilus assembly protein TadG-related protein n=1 Tax=Salipaludibacillus sp. CF4.18 TaxID=3373081 RepID=UPI003EE7209A
MMELMRKMTKDEDGNALILLTFGLAAMIAILGLVIDGGHLYMSKSHLQKTANAAALSGAQEIVNSEAAVNEVVDYILASHGEQASLFDSSIENDRKLTVDLEKPVPVFFSSLFGVDSVPVKARASAQINPMDAAKGVVPLGIDKSVELVHGETYTLKVDAGDSTEGNFGVLALEGPGAKNYEETLKSGFDEELRIGDVINTQTGNIDGPTQRSMNHRIESCPSNDPLDRDCSRVMLVIVYEPTEPTQPLRSVRITGFAYFYVANDKVVDSTIEGRFIKRAGADSTGEENSPDYGAYAIKLSE